MLGTYLFLRYVTLVRADGPRAGSVEWAREVKRRVRGGNVKAEPKTEESISNPNDQEQPDVKEEPHDDSQSDGSAVDDTTVVIGEDSPDRRFSFKELDGRDSPVFVKREPIVTAVETEQPQVVEAL